MEREMKQGHPVLGTILGVLGILAALLLCLMAGIIGGAVAGILGLAALLLGIFAMRKSDRGLGAVITGAIAIILAIALTVGVAGLLTNMKAKAVESGKAPLIEKYMSETNLGLVGIVLKLPTGDSGLMNQVMDEMNYLGGLK